MARAASVWVEPGAADGDAEGAAVWVVKDGRLTRQPVRVGERVGNEVSLTQGPDAGTQVVVAPDPKHLRDGRNVKVEAAGG